MSVSDLIRWRTYYEFEPFGAEGEKRLIGTLIASKCEPGTTWRNIFPDPFVEPEDDDPEGEKERAMFWLLQQTLGGKWVEGEDHDSRGSDDPTDG